MVKKKVAAAAAKKKVVKKKVKVATGPHVMEPDETITGCGRRIQMLEQTMEGYDQQIGKLHVAMEELNASLQELQVMDAQVTQAMNATKAATPKEQPTEEQPIEFADNARISHVKKPITLNVRGKQVVKQI